MVQLNPTQPPVSLMGLCDVKTLSSFFPLLWLVDVIRRYFFTSHTLPFLYSISSNIPYMKKNFPKSRSKISNYTLCLILSFSPPFLAAITWRLSTMLFYSVSETSSRENSKLTSKFLLLNVAIYW